jgi:hypothetical protein
MGCTENGAGGIWSVGDAGRVCVVQKGCWWDMEGVGDTARVFVVQKGLRWDTEGVGSTEMVRMWHIRCSVAYKV